MPAADPAFVPFLVGAIGVVAGFCAYLIRDTIADNRKQRDLAMNGWQGQTDVTDKLSDALNERNAIDERMLALLKGRSNE